MKIKAVIDTNVLVSWFISNIGAPARIFALLLQNAFQLVVSEAILAEYSDVLTRPHIARRHAMNNQAIRSEIADLRQRALVVESQESITVITSDPDDNKFLECALTGEVGYVVTGDRDLLQLGEFLGIKLVTPAQFLTILEGGEDS